MIDQRQYVIGKLKGYDFETITVGVTAVGLTASKLNTNPAPKEVYITVETDQVRYRYDGTAPTGSVGHLLNNQDTLRVRGFPNLQNLQFIRVTTNATIQVTYER